MSPKKAIILVNFIFFFKTNKITTLLQIIPFRFTISIDKLRFKKIYTNE
jgi:hypothetical protein